MRYAILPLLVLHAALGCPSDDGDDDEGGEVGTGSTQSATSASQTGASSSGSATSASTGDGSAEGGTTLPASCVGVGEDGPGPILCPGDVGCTAECELDTATCCDATQTEWTCVCPDQEAPTSTAAEPCTWFSDACG
jgi:hypothetical protein